MISAMRRSMALFCLVACSVSARGAAGPDVTKAYVDGKGSVHILMADGRQHTIAPQKWQDGGSYTDVSVAQDGKTVGWVANQMLAPFEGGTNYAYEIGVDVEVWRAGKAIARFAPGVIQDWVFLKNGEEVAIHTAPPHGQEFYDCTRFDVRLGKELEHWSLDRRDYVVPEWAKPLLVNDPLPGPDEISNWFPDAKEKKALRTAPKK
jgi:hypothetical protein